MTPSLTLPRSDVFGGVEGRPELTFPSLSQGVSTDSGPRSRRALLSFAHQRLQALAVRQRATSDLRYALVLRLIGVLISDGSPTPQIGSNGEGGILVEWLVDGQSLTVDYEDETEILISAVTPDGLRFSETITTGWTQHDHALLEGRRFLSEVSAGLRHAAPLF